MTSMMQLAPIRQFMLVCSTWALAHAKRLLALITLGLLSSAAFAQTATTTTLTLSQSSAYGGQTITITARVTGNNPTGSVTVYDGGRALFYFNLSSGTASTTYSFTTVGAHNLTATYAGNSTNAASTSAPVTLTIYTRPATTTSLVVSPTAAYLGQTINFTATVTGSASPTGVVYFNNNSGYVAQGTVNASGVATGSWVINQTSATLSLTASYQGDANNAPSTSASVPATNSPAPVTTQLTCPASAPVATAINCTVTATSPSIYANPGAFTLRENGTTVGSGTLTYVGSNPTTFRGTITLPATAAPASVAGSHSLVAQTTATTQAVASTSPATTVVVQQRTPTTTLSASPTTAGTTQVITLTATLANGLNATGNVTFRDGSTVLGTAPLSGTQATLNTSFTTAGSHNLTATYNGDTNNAANTSAAVTETVVATTPTTTALSLSPTSIAAGTNTTLTATVNSTNASGTVVFSEGSTVLGTASVIAGQASLTRAFGTVGTHPLTAAYWGDTGYGASTSAPVNLTVTHRSTSTALSSTLTQANQGQAIPVTATVNGAAPSGPVSFWEGSTLLGTANVSNGAATFNASFTALGAHTLTATYGGDANNLGSGSSGVVVTIQPGPVPPATSAPVVAYEYDAQGNPTKATVAPGVSGFGFATQATYDSLNRLKDSTDPRNGKTQFAYDGLDRLTRVTDPRNLVTQYPRNGLGDATQLQSPDTGTASHTYDDAGNLKTRTDSRGVLATYSYDALNRLTGVVYSKTGMTPQSFGWTYDETGAGFAYGIGRLTSTSHPSGSGQYRYDAFGRLVADTQRVNATAGANAAQISTTVGYQYDAAGNLTRITYPSGAQLNITLTNGQPTALSLAKDAGSTANPLISGIEFEPFGGVKRWQWAMQSGNQLHERIYDQSGRPVRYRLGNTLRDVSYDAADRITGYAHYDATTGVAQASLNQSFGYDQNGRLTTVSTATSTWGIGYDANGNRTSVTLNGSPSTYTTEATSNKLTSITSPARSFGYDQAGNTTSDSSGYTATYDTAGRLAAITLAGVTTTYSYNNAGQRVRKFSSSGASSTVVFVMDQQGHLLGEYSSTGAPIREYVWLGNTPVAMFVPNGSNPPTTYYFHADHLGAPRVVTDAANNIRWRWMAEPFGTSAPETNPSGLGAFTQNLRFPGQYADAESGLYYNYFRSYDSTTGRYNTSDPVGLAGGINTFTYVYGNPLSWIDPLGLAGAGGSRPGVGRPQGGGPTRSPPVIGVFGCLGAFCLTSTPQDSDPQASIELTLGGGIEICDAPTPAPPANMCKKSCGMYDPNCDDQVQPPGIPWPVRLGGAFFGPSFKRDGRFCLRVGPHASVPLVPSVDIGGLSER